MDIEKLIAELDEILSKMEGDLTLEDCLKLFETAITKTDKCFTMLNEYKAKLEKLKEKMNKLND